MVLFCLVMVGPGQVCAQSQREAGDVLSIVLPVATLGVELLRQDYEGARQFALTLATTLVATEALKRTTHAERPDGSNDESFPSGHAARAFPAATYVHRRHGFGSAWPIYAAALYVGYTRVDADRHTWGDVAGAAAIAAAAAWCLVEPQSSNVAVVPMFGRKYVGCPFRPAGSGPRRALSSARADSLTIRRSVTQVGPHGVP